MYKLDVLKLTFSLTLLGMLSSGLGGFLGGIIKPKNKAILSSLYEITAGMMTGIVCFDMLPESFYLTNVLSGIIGVIIGVMLVFCLDYILEQTNKKSTNLKKNKYSVTALVVIVSMAAHNILEGLAVGSSLVYSTSFGISVMISIFLHDIPEGMIVGITENSSKISILKIVLDSIFVGMTVGLGVFIGQIVGNISDTYISLSLSLASGAMLYIVSCDLIPSSKKISSNKISYVMYIVGILLGVSITNL